jgi:hypothetical protein
VVFGDHTGTSDASTEPLPASTVSLAEASRRLGWTDLAPSYVPASVALGPQHALDAENETVRLTYYGSDQNALVLVTETSAQPAASQAEPMIVTVDGIDLALRFDANLARFKDGTITRHAYAAFARNGVSFTLELFAPVNDTAEQTGAELVRMATSMIEATPS